MPRYKRGGSILQSLIYGQKHLQPKARETMARYGEQRIQSIVIGRYPLVSAITWATNQLSNEHYDNLFHLFIVVNGNVLIEKNERVNIAPFTGWTSTVEQLVINNPPNCTINELVQRAEKRMGADKFYTYQADTNNCQVFISNILLANGINEGGSFILQNTQDIFKNAPSLKNQINKYTDIAHRLGVLYTGDGI